MSVTDVAPKPRRHGNRTASSNPQAYQVGAGCALGAQNMLPKRVCAGRAKSPGLAYKTTMKKNVASLAKEAAREVILGTPGFETDYKAAQKTDGLDQAAQVRYWRTKMEGSGAADGQDGQDAKKRKAVGNAKLRVKLLESAKNAVSGGKAISKLSVPQLEAIMPYAHSTTTRSQSFKTRVNWSLKLKQHWQLRVVLMCWSLKIVLHL